MSPDTTTVRLDTGLPSEKVSALCDLIARVTGHAMTSPPLIAPAMLLSKPTVSARLPLPVPSAGTVLIHDYQAITLPQPLVCDVHLDVACSVSAKGSGKELSIDFGGGGALRTAMRIVTDEELAQAAPLALRDGDFDANAPTLSVSQADVDEYLSISGDTNPIHQATGVAEKIGLESPIVPGMFVLGLMQAACDQALQENATGLRARFAAPVLVGETIQISSISRAATKARAFVHSGDKGFAVVDLTYS